MNLTGVVEGLLFAVGDEGITLKALCDIVDIDKEKAKEILKELQKRYEGAEYGIRVSYLGDAFKLTTKKEHKDYYHKLLGNPESQSLSESSLEVLAIVAYNQPITRIMVDEMRGVACGQVLRKLCARGLVKIVGKSKMPGKPNLYGTTKEFLDYFGLASIEDLPKINVEEETKEEETELFTSIYKEPIENDQNMVDA